jgi:hypothetical protein
MAKPKYLVGGQKVVLKRDPQQVGTILDIKFNTHLAPTHYQVKWAATGLTTWVRAKDLMGA